MVGHEAKVGNGLHAAVLKSKQDEVGGRIPAGDVRCACELPFEAHDAQRDVLLLVPLEVSADLLAAALRLGNEVEATVVADERADAVPVSRVEETRIPIEIAAGRGSGLCAVGLSLKQCSPPADERSFHSHDRGPHGFGGLLQRGPEYLLQYDRAPLRHRK